MSKTDRNYSEMFRIAVDCTMRPVAWLVSNYVPRRNITLFHGAGEGCKSLMALHYAARISRGQQLEFDTSGDPPTEGCVLILAQEDSVEDTIKPRLTLAGADMSKIHFRATGQDIRLPEDIEALRWLIQTQHVVLVIIDTLDDFATTSTKNNQSVRKVLNGLGDLADEENIAIIAICHWTKQRSSKGSLRDKIAGSFGILARGRCAFAFVRDPDDQGILMISTKGNLGGRKPSVLFDLDVQPVQIDGQPVDHPRILYLGTSPITEDDFEGRPSKVDVAVEYLEKILANEPADSRQILENSPCSRQTLFYAKKQLGITDYREGQGENHRSYWQLPEGYFFEKERGNNHNGNGGLRAFRQSVDGALVKAVIPPMKSEGGGDEESEEALTKKYQLFRTPRHITQAILRLERIQGSVLEPCVGKGDLVRELFGLPDVAVKWSDIRDWGFERTEVRNFLTVEGEHYDVIVTNPPHSDPAGFVRQAKKLADKVIMLLSLHVEHNVGWSDIRNDEAYPLKAVYAFTQSIRWVNLKGNLSGKLKYGWFVFERGYEGPTIRTSITFDGNGELKVE